MYNGHMKLVLCTLLAASLSFDATATSRKKIGSSQRTVGVIASIFIGCGTGQMLQGRWEEGLGFAIPSLVFFPIAAAMLFGGTDLQVKATGTNIKITKGQGYAMLFGVWYLPFRLWEVYEAAVPNEKYYKVVSKPKKEKRLVALFPYLDTQGAVGGGLTVSL